MKSKVNVLTRLRVLNAISDEISQELLNAIAINGEGKSVVELLKLSRKRYYTRISRLLNANLIDGVRGKYRLTVFGMIIYEVQLKLGQAVNERWKLKELEETSSYKESSKSEQNNIAEDFINNTQMKNILVDAKVSA